MSFIVPKVFRNLKFRENRLLLKLVLSLLLPSMAILIVISAFFCLTYGRESMQDIVSNSFMMLSNISKPIGYMMESAKQITFEIYKSQNIFPLISAGVTNSEKLQAATYLNNMLAANSNIYSIYIYKDGKSLLRSGGSALFEESDLSVEKLIMASPQLHPMPRRITTNNGELDLISIVYSDVNARRNNYYVVLNLRPNIINLSQDQKFLHAGQKLVIADSSGNVLAHTDEGLFASNVSDTPYFKRSYASKSDHGTLDVDIGRGRGVAAYLSVSNGMYMAYFISDYNSFYEQTTRTTTIILAFCGAIFLLLIAASFFISYKVYTPLNSIFTHIRGLVRSKPGEKGMDNDLRHAAGAIGKAIDRLNSLEQEGSGSHGNMKNNFIYRLLSGKRAMAQNEFAEGAERYLKFLVPAGGGYQAVVLRVDNYRKFIETNSMEAVQFQLSSIESIGEDLLSEDRICRAFVPDTEQVVLFIGFQRQPGALSPHSAELKKIVDTVAQLFGISLTAGISEERESASMEDLKRMYDEAYAYTGYRALHGKGAIYCQDNVKTRREKDEKARELADAVVSSAKNGTQEQFNGAIDALFDHICAFNYTAILDVLFHTAESLIKIADELQPHGARLEGSGVEQARQAIKEYEDYGQIKEWFSDQYTRIHNLVSALKNSRASDLLEAAIEYITARYNDPNLSASLIAEKLGITPQYFSKLFKQLTAMSFPDYLSDIRLENARRLLSANPMLSVSSICAKIGYNSASYFSSSFTRKYGIPPSKFVLLSKEQ